MITDIEVRNYRSLRHVRLTGLGQFVVFYGRNGSGKSNILSAIQAAFDCAVWAPGHSGSPLRRNLKPDDPVKAEDIYHRAGPEEAVSFAITFTDAEERRVLEVTVERNKVEARLDGDPMTDTQAEELRRRGFHSIPAVRSPARRRAENGKQSDVDALLDAGHLEQALYVAQSDPDARRRRAFKQLKELLQREPLCRPDFDPVLYPDGRYGLRENWDIDNKLDGPLELAGLGIAQVYLMLARIMLSGTRVVAVEEPEAHLHAPTTGRQLRMLLDRLVREPNNEIQQLFVATHSNLFDLDPDGYFELTRDRHGATQVERKPLSELHDAHLYEPGPALAVLRELLGFADPSRPVFVGSDGTPFTAQQMINKLERDDEGALEFVRAMHDAAVRSIRARAARSTS